MSTLAIVVVQDARRDAAATTIRANAEEIAKAVQLYQLDHNQYPVNLDPDPDWPVAPILVPIYPDRDYTCAGPNDDGIRSLAQSLYDALSGYLPIPPVVKTGECFVYLNVFSGLKPGPYIGYRLPHAGLLNSDCKAPALVATIDDPPWGPAAFCILWASEDLEAFTPGP